MNGFVSCPSYERMWWSLRHKVEEEYAKADREIEPVLEAAYQAIRQAEIDCFRPMEEVPGEGKAPKGVTILYPGFDFRGMWFRLSHAAESEREKYGLLRGWMRDIEQKELVDYREFSATDVLDKLMEFYKLTKAAESGKEKAKRSSVFLDAAAQRLASLAAELDKLIDDLGVGE